MKDRNVPIRVVLGAAAAVGLYVISRDTYLLFHVLAELFSIVAAWTVFVIFWNTRKIHESPYFLLIGIAALFVGFLDLVHMLAYKGMGVIPGYGTNTPTQLWIAARSIQAATMVIAPFFIVRKVPGPARIYHLPCRYRAAARIDPRMGSLPGLLRRRGGTDAV